MKISNYQIIKIKLNLRSNWYEIKCASFIIIWRNWVSNQWTCIVISNESVSLNTYFLFQSNHSKSFSLAKWNLLLVKSIVYSFILCQHPCHFFFQQSVEPSKNEMHKHTNKHYAITLSTWHCKKDVPKFEKETRKFSQQLIIWQPNILSRYIQSNSTMEN